MKLKKRLFLNSLIILILFSCQEKLDIIEHDPIKKNNHKAVSELISFGQKMYIDNSDLKLDTDKDEPNWAKYELVYSSPMGDTILLTVPLIHEGACTQKNLVLTSENGLKRMSSVKDPLEVSTEIPDLFRQRVAFIENGVYTIYKIKYSDDGKVRLLKMRTPKNIELDVDLRSSGDNSCFEPEKYGNCFNGGWLPEVIVYGSNGSSQKYPTSIYEIYGNGINITIGGGSFGNGNGNGSGNGSGNGNKPDYEKAEEIIKSNPIQERIKQVVKLLPTDTSAKNGRRERGFWIYYNPSSGKYTAGKDIVGDWVQGGEGSSATISPGGSSSTSNDVEPGNKPITFYHRHSPATNLSNGERREVGPSQGDKDFADSNNIDIIVTDYVGTQDPFDGKYYINAGAAADSPTKEYIYTGSKK